jgi:hypothetical protein
MNISWEQAPYDPGIHGPLAPVEPVLRYDQWGRVTHQTPAEVTADAQAARAAEAQYGAPRFGAVGSAGTQPGPVYQSTGTPPRLPEVVPAVKAEQRRRHENAWFAAKLAAWGGLALTGAGLLVAGVNAEGGGTQASVAVIICGIIGVAATVERHS